MNEVKGKSKLGGNFFEEIGGPACLARVHRSLYDKLFAHPWLKGFFAHTRREHVESQQTDFWAGLMGGPNVYGGRSPRHAHVHMFIPAQAFTVRHALLGEALEEAGVPADLREKWLRLDAGFERAIVNKSPDECHGRFTSDPVIIVPLRDGLAAQSSSGLAGTALAFCRSRLRTGRSALARARRITGGPPRGLGRFRQP